MEQIQNGLDFITINGAKTMNLKDYGIEVGKSANFIVLDAKNEFDAICERVSVLASVRHGEFLYQKEPAKVVNAIDFLQ